MKSLNELFTEHPREVGMSYFGHFCYAWTVTARLFICFLACFVHSFFPFLFTHTTSKIVGTLNEEFISHQPGHQESNLTKAEAESVS